MWVTMWFFRRRIGVTSAAFGALAVGMRHVIEAAARFEEVMKLKNIMDGTEEDTRW